MKIQLKTGEDPENFSIEIRNMDKDEVVETLTFEEANKVYTREVTVPEYGCYRVSFKNTDGNGCGGGFWGIKDADNKTIISGSSSSNVFRYVFPIELKYSGEGVESVDDAKVVNIYPNPASNNINISSENLSEINVYNSLGQLVYTEKTEVSTISINVSSWSNGLYYVNVEAKDGVRTTQKIIVNK